MSSSMPGSIITILGRNGILWLIMRSFLVTIYITKTCGIFVGLNWVHICVFRLTVIIKPKIQFSKLKNTKVWNKCKHVRYNQ